jgi:hypothetical protein
MPWVQSLGQARCRIPWFAHHNVCSGELPLCLSTALLSGRTSTFAIPSSTCRSPTACPARAKPSPGFPAESTLPKQQHFSNQEPAAIVFVSAS